MAIPERDITLEHFNLLRQLENYKIRFDRSRRRFYPCLSHPTKHVPVFFTNTKRYLLLKAEVLNSVFLQAQVQVQDSIIVATQVNTL